LARHLGLFTDWHVAESSIEYRVKMMTTEERLQLAADILEEGSRYLSLLDHEEARTKVKPGRPRFRATLATRPPCLSGVVRQIRYRQRRRNGVRCLRIELHESEVDALVRLGWLSTDGRRNNEAVIAALYHFFEHTFRGGRLSRIPLRRSDALFSSCPFKHFGTSQASVTFEEQLQLTLQILLSLMMP
jgi:hypothetical protein